MSLNCSLSRSDALRALRLGRGVAAVSAAVTVAGCRDPVGVREWVAPERAMAGGSATVDDATSQAFSLPSPALVGARLTLHARGDAAFEQSFVRAPARVAPGLGPIFNRASCVACHDGDGRTREAALLRISAATSGAGAAPVPVEGFGTQLQDDAVFGIAPEGRVTTTWADTTVVFGGGETYTLRRPTHTIDDAYTPLPAGTLTSARMPRPVFGLGLLEAVAPGALEGLADPFDADSDGISGRVNRVWDVARGSQVIGRFGWKASQPTVRQQVAAAYAEDMGITTVMFSGDPAVGQSQADGMDDDPELDAATLDATTFYVQSLGVPRPRGLDDPRVLAGEERFGASGCVGCHVPRLTTGTLPGVPEVSGQAIYPYSDLLLHDMGPGLADHRPDWDATGSEWRTPPLWGIGLTRRVNGHSDLLHDGRARTLTEAILWHDGEARRARSAFLALAPTARLDLITFLESL